MTPYERSRWINSPDAVRYKDTAAKMLDDLLEPGPPINDNFYRTAFMDMLATMLKEGIIAEPGAATGSKPDPRLAAIEAKWPGLVAKLAG